MENVLIRFLNILVYVGYVILYPFELLIRLFSRILHSVRVSLRGISVINFRKILKDSFHNTLDGFRRFWRDAKILFRGYVLNELKRFKPTKNRSEERRVGK